MSSPPLPEAVGRYRILGELGRGAMGRVFRAHDPHTDRAVALKVLALAGERSEEQAEEARTRFLREARAAGRLSHRGIVTVFDADVDAASGSPFLAMEIVEGRSLADLLAVQGPLSWRRSTAIAAEIADALDHAHGRGVVHRDLKPANVLIADDGAVKVSDFGVAKLVDESHTVAGTLLGTPSYMAPEQIRSHPIDGRADLYSLGAVLYEMLTGEPPFLAETLVGVAHKAIHVDPRPPSFGCPDLPFELETLVLRLLAKDAGERPGSGAETAAALRAVAELEAPVGSTDTATLAVAPEKPDSTPNRRLAHRELRGAIAIVGFAALVAAALGIGLRVGRAAPDAKPRQEGAPADPLVGSPPPAEDAESPAPQPIASEPAAPTNAALEVRFVNRLKRGRMTVWIDGQPAWSTPLAAPGNPLRRLGGEMFSTSIPVAAGRREIEVRITNATERVDARGSVRVELAAGERRRLRVVLVPLRSKLRLKWEP